MAIVVGTSTATSGNAGAAPTLVINANVLAGDLLILCVTVRDSTTDPTELRSCGVPFRQTPRC